MQLTDGTTMLPTNSQASRSPGRDDERGVIALEWLLIVGAVAGLAAMSTLIVQRVVDDSSEVPVDPLVRVLEADIAAAFLASEADTAALSQEAPYIDADFEQRCEVALLAAFGGVVHTAQWRSPVTIPADPPTDPPTLETGARCEVTPQAGLGG